MTDSTSAERKAFMIVNRRPPHGSSNAQEALDATLMAGMFNQQVSAVFLDDGVYQLLAEQQPDAIGRKHIAATLPMLEMYDVQDIIVEQESMVLRGLDETHFAIPVTIMPAHKLGQLMAEQDVLLTF